MTDLRESKKARTRLRLEHAALDAFGRLGYDDATINEIANTCGVSPRTFFRYFRSKEELLFSDSDARLQLLVSEISQRPRSEPTFVALSACMRALARHCEGDREMLRGRARIIATSTTLKRLRTRDQAGWGDAIVLAFQARETPREVTLWCHELRLVAATFTAAWRVALSSWLEHPSPPELCELVDDAIRKLGIGFARPPDDVHG